MIGRERERKIIAREGEGVGKLRKCFVGQVSGNLISRVRKCFGKWKEVTVDYESGKVEGGYIGRAGN